MAFLSMSLGTGGQKKSRLVSSRWQQFPERLLLGRILDGVVFREPGRAFILPGSIPCGQDPDGGGALSHLAFLPPSCMHGAYSILLRASFGE